ncbi:hypothetical protein GCM10018962_77320 [Dactylosporangium matsuzakiense]
MEVFDVDGWVKPGGCPCTFRRRTDRSVVLMHCPTHGVDSGPAAGPPDWPPRRVVPEDQV